MVFHLPMARYSPGGGDVFWSQQEGATDPNIALNNHLWINNPPKDSPLFTYRHARGLHPPAKKAFLDQINMIAVSLGEDSFKSHRICIEGT